MNKIENMKLQYKKNLPCKVLFVQFPVNVKNFVVADPLIAGQLLQGGLHASLPIIHQQCGVLPLGVHCN